MMFKLIVVITGFHFCAGSLINKWWLVSAAHCNVRYVHVQDLLGIYGCKIQNRISNVTTIYIRTSHRVALGVHDHSSFAGSFQIIRISKVYSERQKNKQNPQQQYKLFNVVIGHMFNSIHCCVLFCINHLASDFCDKMARFIHILYLASLPTITILF